MYSQILFNSEDVSPDADKMDWGSVTDRAFDHVFFVELIKGLGMTLGKQITGMSLSVT